MFPPQVEHGQIRDLKRIGERKGELIRVTTQDSVSHKIFATRVTHRRKTNVMPNQIQWLNGGQTDGRITNTNMEVSLDQALNRQMWATSQTSPLCRVKECKLTPLEWQVCYWAGQSFRIHKVDEVSGQLRHVLLYGLLQPRRNIILLPCLLRPTLCCFPVSQ